MRACADCFAAHCAPCLGQVRDRVGAEEDLQSHGMAYKRQQLQVRVGVVACILQSVPSRCHWEGSWSPVGLRGRAIGSQWVSLEGGQSVPRGSQREGSQSPVGLRNRAIRVKEGSWL